METLYQKGTFRVNAIGSSLGLTVALVVTRWLYLVIISLPFFYTNKHFNSFHMANSCCNYTKR